MRWLRWCLAGLLAVCLLPWAAAQVVPPAPALGKAIQVPPTGDYLDFVFLASDRPVLLRLHLQSGGRPYYAPWDDYMKELFAQFDRDGDRVLNKAEAERAPNQQFLQNHLQGALGFPYQGQTVRIADMDTNKDGKVDQTEFANYYRRTFGPLRFSATSSQSRTDGVTDTFYQRLDTNKDGKLSAEELTRASAILAPLDSDEDEMLTDAELSPPRSYTGVIATPARQMVRRDSAEEAGFLEIKPGERNEGVAKQILTHFDQDKNHKLSRAESGLDRKVFDSLDANHDGQLDASELSRFWQRDADLELIADAGSVKPPDGLAGLVVRGVGVLRMTAAQPKRVDLFNPSRRTMPLSDKVERRDPQTLRFSLGDARFQLFASDQVIPRFRNLRQFYVRQFELADTNKKGVVASKQAQAVDFLKEIFVMADKDGNGQLTRTELLAYLDLQERGSSSQMTLGLANEGRNLFELIDANQDGRLSVRELRTAWSRFQPLAHSESGLARTDIPRRLQITLGQGQQGFRPGGNTSPPEGAPKWFVKMDRNQDSDISPREFIGTDEDFRKLDADGDGLISSAEARLYEARLKKK